MHYQWERSERRGRRAARGQRLLVGAVLVVAAAGCGILPGGGGDDASSQPITGMLAAGPDTPDNRQALTVVDHARLAEALDTTWPPGGGADAFLTEAFDSREVAPPAQLIELIQGQDAWREQFGFAAADVTATATARTGVPPSEISVFRTTVEPSTIAAAVTSDPIWSGDLRTAERGEATVYTWGDDPLDARTDRTSRARPLGQGGALAVTDDGLVVRGADPATVEAAIDTTPTSPIRCRCSTQ